MKKVKFRIKKYRYVKNPITEDEFKKEYPDLEYKDKIKEEYYIIKEDYLTDDELSKLDKDDIIYIYLGEYSKEYVNHIRELEKKIKIEQEILDGLNEKTKLEAVIKQLNVLREFTVVLFMALPKTTQDKIKKTPEFKKAQKINELITNVLNK